jgi:hypothetical protein
VESGNAAVETGLLAWDTNANKKSVSLHYFYIQSGFLMPIRDIKIGHKDRGSLQVLKRKLEDVLRTGGDPNTEVDVMVEFCDRMGRVSHNWCAASCTIDAAGTLRVKEIIDNDEDISGGADLNIAYNPGSDKSSRVGTSFSAVFPQVRKISAPLDASKSNRPFLSADALMGYKHIDLTLSHQVTEFKSKTYTLSTLTGPLTVVLHYFYIVRGNMVSVREIKIGSDDLTLLGELASSVRRVIRSRMVVAEVDAEHDYRDSTLSY